MDWDAYRRPDDPPGLEFVSPSATDDKIACALMVVSKAKKDIGDLGAGGRLRHRGIELYLNDAAPTLMEASKVAAQQFAGELPDEKIVEAVAQLRKIPQYFLANVKQRVVSVEGSNVPPELTRRLYEKDMLHVIMRDKPGRWGAPYGLRLIVDAILLSEDGLTVDVYDWKGANVWFKPNDIQAIMNYLALAHPERGLLKAWGIEPQVIRWTGIGIPSLMRDPFEFKPSEWESYLDIIDTIQEEWQTRRQTKPATPGKHCKDCSLNGKQACPATRNAAMPVQMPGSSKEISAASRDDVASWSDQDLVSAKQILESRSGHIEAILGLIDPEVKARAKQRVIGPVGMRYKAGEQGGNCTWHQQSAWALACKAAGLAETWAIPEELQSLFGLITSKAGFEEFLKSRARGEKDLEDHYLAEMKSCYSQDTRETLKLVKCPENVPIQEDVGPELTMQEVNKLRGLPPKEPSILNSAKEPCSQCSTADVNVTHGDGSDCGAAPAEQQAAALLGGPAPDPNEGRSMGTCKSCGYEIWWGKTSTGKSCPFDADGASHFTTCPSASKHSKKKPNKGGPPENEGEHPYSPEALGQD